VIGLGETIAFWILGPLALAGGLGMVFARNAVHSALWLAQAMLCLGALYMVQQAPFLGFVQIIVYTGAIMMLFLFVLMLVGVSSADSLVETIKGQRKMAVLVGLGFGVVVLLAVGHARLGTFKGMSVANGGNGNVKNLADLIFSQYFWAFEVTSALLITAAVGAMILAHIEREPGQRQSQKDLSRARFLTARPQTFPGPGVFARGNSVAVPALLPDGTFSEETAGTGLEMQPVEQMPRPTGRAQLGSPDDALGTLDPAPRNEPGGPHR
jgi:NADH-quinone oxidoreductase subunit J